eukprot:scaffold199852_cov44-Tisochrysis_lutea.AAC.2
MYYHPTFEAATSWNAPPRGTAPFSTRGSPVPCSDSACSLFVLRAARRRSARAMRHAPWPAPSCSVLRGERGLRLLTLE